MRTQRLNVVLDANCSYSIRVGKHLLQDFGVQLSEALGMAPGKTFDDAVAGAMSNVTGEELGEATSGAPDGDAASEALGENRTPSAKKIIVVTDSNVGPLYLDRVLASLNDAGFDAFDLTVPAGESSKNLEVAGELYAALQHLGAGRDSVIVALGGGVVGDLAGFVASTYMRGVAFAQIPTTLLAMVDSSIGGKTAVNLSSCKNLVGSFYQPIYVAASLDVLQSLPAREWDNGFAEIAKSALVDGGEFFEWLCARAPELREQREAIVQQAIVYALTFKAKVVVADEKENGPRECLNYGHTFAHALEVTSNFRISHGIAVAEGMRFAARLGTEAANVDASFITMQDALLDQLGLVSINEAFGAEDLYAKMCGDKKVRANKLRFVFVETAGSYEIKTVDRDLVKIYSMLWEQARLT